MFTHDHGRVFILAAVAIVFLAGPHATHADGKFFARVDIADEPGIQAQRALIAFRDGIETLIVQSDVNAKGESVGWLLPLPTNPTAIEAAPPNCLRVLDSFIEPNIRIGEAGPLLSITILFLTTLAFTTNHLRRLQRGQKNAGLINTIAAFIVVLLMLSVMLPSLSRSRGIESVALLQSVRAGVYDVSVIRSESFDAVKDWLRNNEFRSTERADIAIKQYLKEGWCVLAARVHAEAEQVTHHPLIITFPTRQAVYPLRLTGSDAKPIRLDLFVVAEEEARAGDVRVVLRNHERKAALLSANGLRVSGPHRSGF